MRITPDDLVVLSFPGPDRSIRMEELGVGVVLLLGWVLLMSKALTSDERPAPDSPPVPDSSPAAQLTVGNAASSATQRAAYDSRSGTKGTDSILIYECGSGERRILSDRPCGPAATVREIDTSLINTYSSSASIRSMPASTRASAQAVRGTSTATASSARRVARTFWDRVGQ